MTRDDTQHFACMQLPNQFSIHLRTVAKHTSSNDGVNYNAARFYTSFLPCAAIKGRHQ